MGSWMGCGGTLANKWKASKDFFTKRDIFYGTAGETAGGAGRHEGETGRRALGWKMVHGGHACGSWDGELAMTAKDASGKIRIFCGGAMEPAKDAKGRENGGPAGGARRVLRGAVGAPAASLGTRRDPSTGVSQGRSFAQDDGRFSRKARRRHGQAAYFTVALRRAHDEGTPRSARVSRAGGACPELRRGVPPKRTSLRGRSRGREPMP